MRLQTTACLVIGVAAILGVAPVPSFAQPDCVNVWFILDPGFPSVAGIS